MVLKLDKLSLLGLLLALWCSAALAQEQIHIVKKGDTLYSLGRQYGVSVEHIQKLNGLSGSALS
ncbi:MAG TPA: LysM domain-containing protein, partial [Candidatus Cloacimonadota bacterium]|nr:LysM domain-containing protein [Candidatus Cloacimonadota bacterium]